MMKLFLQIAAALVPVVLAAGLPAAAADAPPAPNPAQAVPATSNISGAEYPRVLPDLRVVFRIKAPDAQKVEFDLGKHYAATKDGGRQLDRHDRPAGARISLLLPGD